LGVLTPGRRTITRIIGVIDPEGRRAHDAYHRLLRDGVWQMPKLWQTLTVTIVDRLIDEHAEVCLDLDDTLHHKSGRRVEGAGVFRDAVRSTRNRTVHALGLNLVVITARIVPPWGGMPIGLPVNVRMRRKHEGATTVELAQAMLVEISGWLPERTLQLAADGAYASLCGAGLDRVHITSRLRRDAAVFELTPPRTGRRGRPRKKGDRLPSLADLAATATGWATVQFDQRGTTVTRQIWSRKLLWYRVAKDHHPCCWSSCATPTASNPTTTSSPPTPTPPRHGSRPTTPDAGRSRSPSATRNSIWGAKTPNAGNVSDPNVPPASRCGCTPPSGCGTCRCGAPNVPGPPPRGIPPSPTPHSLTRSPRYAPRCGTNELHGCALPSPSHTKFATSSSTYSPKPPDNRAPHALQRPIPPLPQHRGNNPLPLKTAKVHVR
jgi:hypothetical protein